MKTVPNLNMFTDVWMLACCAVKVNSVLNWGNRHCKRIGPFCRFSIFEFLKFSIIITPNYYNAEFLLRRILWTPNSRNPESLQCQINEMPNLCYEKITSMNFEEPQRHWPNPQFFWTPPHYAVSDNSQFLECRIFISPNF